jgi:hypothetical protein
VVFRGQNDDENNVGGERWQDRIHGDFDDEGVRRHSKTILIWGMGDKLLQWRRRSSLFGCARTALSLDITCYHLI